MFHGFVRNSEICEIGYVGATIGRPAVTQYDFAWVFGESEDCAARRLIAAPALLSNRLAAPNRRYCQFVPENFTHPGIRNAP